MSQAEDIAAINDYFNRMPGKTQAAKDAKASWTAWFNGLSFLSKSFSDDVLAEATRRRISFDAANGEVKRADDGGLTKEEQEYFKKLPSVNVTGMSPDQAKTAIATANKVGAQIPVPATLLVASIGSLRQGAKGPAVKKWQELIGVKPADGNFGPGTTAATKKFQTAHAIKADGVVGPASWTAAQAGSPGPTAVANQILYPELVKPEVSPKQNFDLANVAALTPDVAIPKPAAQQATAVQHFAAVKPSASTSRPTLRKGSTGEPVNTWQKGIGTRVTGTFDDATFKATKAWQVRNGLVGDGVVGAASWAKLDAVGTSTTPAAVAQVTDALQGAKVQVASLFGGGFSNLPTWGKWTLGVLTLGALAYGYKYSKQHTTSSGQPLTPTF